jgi:uncharacterized protein (TIGR02147 family)
MSQRHSKKTTASENAKEKHFPDLFHYTNYRQYLTDFYQAKKKQDPKFSLRVFAAQAQFPSHGLLKFLMEGKRNLSKKTLLRLCPALGLNPEQTVYFENLVFFNQAKTLEDKGHFYDKLISGSGASQFKKLESSQLQIFRKWQSVVLREMLSLKQFRNSAEWLASKMLFPVEPHEIKDSFQALISAGVIKKTPNGFKPTDPDITTDDEIKSFLVKSYHVQMMRLAILAQETLPGSERDISSACFAIKASDLPALKKQLQLMRKELRNFASSPGEGDRVVQVNIQLFPLTRDN